MSAGTALLQLSPEEIRSAPHEVLASLVQRYQDELALLLEESQVKDDRATHVEEDRVRVEHQLDAAKRRIDELLHEQNRTEDELSGRIEVLDKLRATVRELEREKKEATKRYREQVSPERSLVPMPFRSSFSVGGRQSRTRRRDKHGMTRNSTSDYESPI